MEDIVINGVSLNELKRMRTAVCQGANELISKNLEEVTKLVNLIVDEGDTEFAEKLAEQAYTLLGNAKLVAGITGVSFFMPYYEEYGGYDSDEILSSKLDDSSHDTCGTDSFGKLHDLLYDMESQSCGWNSSNC